MNETFLGELHDFLLNNSGCDSDEMEELIGVASEFKVDEKIDESTKIKMQNVTSDIITEIRMTDPHSFPQIELIELTTEKGNTIKVDTKRFGHLRVGDMINIGLEEIK